MNAAAHAHDRAASPRRVEGLSTVAAHLGQGLHGAEPDPSASAPTILALSTSSWSCRAHPTDAERRAAADIYTEGALTAQEVANRHGRSKRWVLDQVARFAVVHPAPHRKGPRPTKRESLLPEIVRRLAAGERQRTVGRELGINVLSLVWRARTGRIHAPELLAVVGDARPCRRSRHRRGEVVLD